MSKYAVLLLPYLLSQVLWSFSSAWWSLTATKYLALCWLFPCCIEGRWILILLFRLCKIKLVWIAWMDKNAPCGCTTDAAWAVAQPLQCAPRLWGRLNETLQFQEVEMMQILKPSDHLLWSCFWVSAVWRLKYLSLILKTRKHISGSKEISRNPNVVPKGFGSHLRQRFCLSLCKSSYDSCRNLSDKTEMKSVLEEAQTIVLLNVYLRLLHIVVFSHLLLLLRSPLSE